MKTIIELDKCDIQEIVAKMMNVPIEQVTVICYMDTVGYGVNEERVPAVRAEVKK